MWTRIVVGLTLLSAFAFSQTSTSSISGIVTDSSGAVVPGASVTVTNEATGVAEQQTTTAAGLYSFPALPAGSYTITVESKGFKTARRAKNLLEVNTPITVNISLEIGETTEVVMVEADAEQIQVSNAAIANVVTQKAIVELPLNGRNPLNLLVLEPGVVQRSAGGAGTGVHVNGSRDMSHNVTIDGIDANESSVNNPLNNVYRLNPDNTSEYKVTTSNATAEEGRNSGASVSVATRSGSNQFHGTVFEFFRNTALNANEFFANALGTAKPDIKLNQYGLEFSGPVKKNRSFFFFSWQGQKINFSQPIDQVFGGTPDLYTATARAGVFRFWRADPRNPFRLGGVEITRNSPLLVDSYTGALRPGVRECASPTDLNCVASYNFAADDPRRIGVDPVIQRFMNARPLPNNFTSGDGLNQATYLWNPPTKVRGPSYMGRLDHRINDNQSLFARYIHADNNTLDGDPNNDRPQVYPGLPPMGEVFRASKNFAIGHRWVVSPRVVNEFTAGISRFVFLFTQGEANPDWPNIPPYARGSGTAFNNFDPGILNTPRTFRAVTTPQVLDNLSIVTGSHIVKTGFNFRFYRHNDQRGQPGGVNVTPLLTFSRTVRPPSGFNIPSMDALDANLLLGAINDVLGIPARLSQTFLGDLKSDAFLPFRSGDVVNLWNVGHRLKQYNFYVQDEWKVRQNLTINAGLRWELNMPPTEAAGRVYVPDRPVVGSSEPVTFRKADSWFSRKNWLALGPRLSFTWTPRNSHTTVVRAGYGMAFDTLSSFQVTAVAGRVPGLTVSCSSTAGGSTTPGCTPVPDRRIAEGFPQEMALPSRKPSEFLTPPVQVLANAPGLTVFDDNLKVPTVHQFNLNIQRELPGQIVVQAGYVGRRGTRLFRAYDINQISADAILPSFLAMQSNLAKGCQPHGAGCPSGVTPDPVPLASTPGLPASFFTSAQTRNDLLQNAAGNLAGRVEQTTVNARLRPNQQFGAITYVDAGGDSYYHSLQTTARKRFANGLLFGVAYTFGKSIDNQSVDPIASSSGGGLSATNSRTPTDIRNWRNERGRSDFDRTHSFTGNFIYELPFGRGKKFGGDMSGILNHIAGGWSVNGVFSASSGEPFSIRSGVRTSNFSHESRAEVIGELPPVRLQAREGVIGPVLFGPEAFCSETVRTNCLTIPAPGDNGAGRNIFNSPGYWNMDTSVSKRFSINERVSMQFRTEFFNVFNHANFDNPRNASVGNASVLARVPGQTCCNTVAPASTQTIIQTGESARVIQLALKILF